MTISLDQAYEVARTAVPDTDPPSWKLTAEYESGTHVVFVNTDPDQSVIGATTILVDRTNGTAEHVLFTSILPMLDGMRQLRAD